MKPATTKKAYVLFPLLLSIAFIFVYTNSYRILDYPPSSVHMWRQSDCAASIKTFFRTDNSVFEPATLNLAGKDGRVASEFPIFYYITAKIQHVVGEHYWIIRSMNFLSYLIGLWALVHIIKRWINNKLLTFTLFILLATSPYYYYYAINLLPNVPAISFSFVGLYFFF